MDELHAELTRGRFALYGCGDQPILVEPEIYFLPGSDCDGIGGYYGGSGGGNSSPPPPQNGPCGLSPNSKTRAGSNKNIFGVNHTETLYLTGTTDRRIKARFWSQNYAIFSSVGTNTRSQNKWADIWWAERADDIYLKYEGQIEQKDAFNNLISFKVESVPPLREKNENKLSTTFQWASAIVGNACDPVTGKCKGKFKPAPPFKIKNWKLVIMYWMKEDMVKFVCCISKPNILVISGVLVVLSFGLIAQDRFSIAPELILRNTRMDIDDPGGFLVADKYN